MLALALLLTVVGQGPNQPGNGLSDLPEAWQGMVELVNRLAQAPIGDLQTGAKTPDRELLQHLARVCPVKLLAVVSAAEGAAIEPPEVESVQGLLDWLMIDDSSYYYWPDAQGRFVALAPLPREPSWLSDDVEMWLAEPSGLALRKLASALPIEAQALVASGLPFAPSALPEGTRRYLADIVSAGGGWHAASKAAADPTARAWIWFSPEITVQAAPHRLGGVWSAGNISLHEVGAFAIASATPPNVPSGDELRALVNNYKSVLTEHGVQDGYSKTITGGGSAVIQPESTAKLPEAQVVVEREESTVGELASLIARAIGATAAMTVAGENPAVVLTRGTWRADELADALTAAGRLTCVYEPPAIRFVPATRYVPACLAAQMVMTDDWYTKLFGPEWLGLQTPLPVAGLPEAQRMWIRRQLEGKDPIGDDAHVYISLNANVGLLVWGQDRGEIADLLDQFIVSEPRRGVFSYPNGSVSWFWRRMPGD